MKQYMKSVMTMAAMLLFTLGAWADPTVTIIKQLNGTVTTSSGDVTYAFDDGVCVLTVTPANGYYVTEEYITAYATVTGAEAQGRTRQPNINEHLLEMSADENNGDPSGVTKYLIYPEEGSNIEVTVNFQSRITLTADMVTLLESETSFTYNGKLQKPTTITVKDGKTDLEVNDNYTITNEGGTEPGTYYVVVTGKGIYQGEVSKPYSINQADLANASIAAITSLTYTGSAQTPEPEVTIALEGATSATTLVKDTDFEYSYSNNTNAATANDDTPPTVTVTGKGNYTGSKSATFTINKVAAAFTAPTAKELTYTGAAQELINTGSSNDGEMQYKLSTDTEWSTSIPKGTDKGTYTVNYKVIGDANHNDTESADVQVTIGAKSIANATITLSKESFDYNGETQKPDITSVKDGETALTLDKDYTVTNEGGKDVNTYTVTITGTGNYTGTATKNFTINKANAEITKAPTAKTLTYTSTAQALVEAGTVSAGTLKYSKTIDGTFAEAIPEETNAGTYTVYYKVDGNENYNGIEASETNKVSVTINPATITGVTLTESALVYNGESQTVEIATVTAGTLVLTNENTDFAKVFDISGNSATERGTHTVTITAKENSNFTGSATADFSIKYRTASLEEFEFEAGQTFGTFYSPEENLELPETIKAYIISGVSGNSVTLTELNYIPMGVPVLVEKIEGTATRPEANPETTDNMLKYASENASLNRSAGTLYVLYNGMFVRATNNTVAVQNVYLQVPVSTPNSARTLSIKGGDGTTAIESVDWIESSDTDRWYDMQGRRIERPTKTGIYLNNGKKVVIK